MKDLCIDEFFYSNFDPWSDRFNLVSVNDHKILKDLWFLIEDGQLLTKNQANLLCRLLQKYKNNFVSENVDLEKLIENQKWQKEFRVIDLTKKIYAEIDSDGLIRICLKFPYSLKSKFDELFVESKEKNFSYWDDEQKVRKIEIYKINFLQILEFAIDHKLQIDKTIWNLADEIDEIWQNLDQIEKRFNVVKNEIKLVNASVSAQEYFETNQSNTFADNLLLAKELGHICDSVLDSAVLQKICSSDNNLFWTTQLEKFLEIHCQTSIKTCVILDRTSDYKNWLKHFIDLCDRFNIPRSEVKVCFREDSKESEFNQWIKNSNLGGKTDCGRIYIFLASPAKWLYKDIKSFKIILVNSLFPHTNKNTQNLINHHPMVIYVSDSKPSVLKDSIIEEL
jgi:hypothetical protein